MKQLQKNYKRIVVKIGSSLFYSANNVWDDSFVYDISRRQISSLIEEDRDVVVVSSGAIAFGMRVLGLKERPRKLEDLQAAAAIGQNGLMNAYRNFFGKNYTGAQILLTRDDFADRKRYLNAQNTLRALLEYRKYRIQRIVPIINENDTVSTEEIKFGDNDHLSALVANLISADLLIILSDVEGLLDKNKKVIRVIEEITPQIKALACPTSKKTCVGGMITKIEAARIAVDSGIPCVIANGKRKNIILSAIENPAQAGTLFVPKKGLAARERWIAFGTKAKGKIVVDDGAKKAILANKSLLSVGIVSVEGNFSPKDVVLITDKEGGWIARGSTTVSSVKIQEVKGRRSDKEVIHCDNIVIL